MRFKLSDEKPRAQDPATQRPRQKALEALLASSRPNHPPPQWSACISPSPELLSSEYHPFVAAAHLAFAEHRPLSFGPEQVWLLLAQGFANHINVHAEDLRAHFVQHQGKKKLVVRRDDFVLDAPDNPWHEVIDAFCDQVKTHVGKRHDLMVSNFSTTTAITRTASCINMMDALSSYFQYELRTLCGIPEFELLGTEQDWRDLRTRIQALEEFSLSWWTKSLYPILDKIIATSQGQIDRTFWESFYKFNGQSGGPFIHGWIHQLFPYLRHGGKLVRNPFLDPMQEGGPTSDQLPSALSVAPVNWEYLGQSIPIQFLGGFFGIAQNLKDLTVSPEIGWAVLREEASQSGAS